jgi:hypothetical protein
MATEKVPDPLGVSIMLSLESVGKHLSGHPTTDIYNRARPARNVGDAHNFPVVHIAPSATQIQASLFIQPWPTRIRAP